jgi:hypothetical protein
MHWTRILELILEFGLLGFLAWRLWSLEGWVCDIPAWLNEIENRLSNHAQRLNIIQDRQWEEPERKRLVFAVDFDGTIVEAKYPEIGSVIPDAVEFCRQAREKGHILILNTCRTGTDLVEAVKFCEEHGIIFDHVNENAVHLIDQLGDCRKIAADYYIDDRNLGKWTWKDAMKILEAS